MLKISHKQLLLSDVILMRQKYPDKSILEIVTLTLKETNRLAMPLVVSELVKEIRQTLEMNATPIAYHGTPDEYKVYAIYEDGEMRECDYASGTSGILDCIVLDGAVLSTIEELREWKITSLKIEAVHEVEVDG